VGGLVIGSSVDIHEVVWTENGVVCYPLHARTGLLDLLEPLLADLLPAFCGEP
jgi:hypothetical protein